MFHYNLISQLVKWKNKKPAGISNGAYPGHMAIAQNKQRNTNYYANTFMHELGHTLGLPEVGHMGRNYSSAMNYDKPEYIGFTDTEWKTIKQGGMAKYL